jgi:hypothetical protein
MPNEILIGKNSLFDLKKQPTYLEKNRRKLTHDPRSMQLQNPPGNKLDVAPAPSILPYVDLGYSDSYYAENTP